MFTSFLHFVILCWKKVRIHRVTKNDGDDIPPLVKHLFVQRFKPLQIMLDLNYIIKVDIKMPRRLILKPFHHHYILISLKLVWCVLQYFNIAYYGTCILFYLYHRCGICGICGTSHHSMYEKYLVPYLVPYLSYKLMEEKY